nr:hypothetical protein [uncultured Rhodopila sp.]
MSTIGEVVDRAGKLVVSVRALVKTDTIEGVVEAAAALGAQQALQDGLTALQGGINKIGTGLAPVAGTLIGVDAVAGVIGLISPLANGIGTLIHDSADLVPELETAKLVAASAQKVIAVAGSGIQEASDFVDETMSYVDPTSFTRLGEDLRELAKQFETLKQQAAKQTTTGQAKESEPCPIPS